MSDSDRIVIPAETTVAIIVAVVALMTLNFLPVGGFYDDGMYTILAKSLATGHGYHFLNLPGEPAAVHYPPIYPLLLALLWKLGPAFPANVIWFKVLNVVLLGIIAWTVCRYAVHVLMLSPGIAVLATLLGTVTIPMLVLTTMVLSEPLFLALALPALILGEEMARHRPERREAIWLGILSGLVVLTRSIGIMLPAAIAAVWLARKNWRATAWYLGTTLFVLSPWLLWSALHASDLPQALRGSYASYSGWFVGGLHDGGLPFVIATMRTNFHLIAAGVSASFQFAFNRPVSIATSIALAFMVGCGAWRVRKRAPVTLVFLALYLGLVLAWPDQPLRFVWGVWPVLMALVMVPLEVFRVPETPRPLRIAVAVVAMALLVGVVRYTSRGYAGRWWESIPRQTSDRAQASIRWVRLHTHRYDVVASEYEPMMYLYSERDAVPVETFTALQYLRDRTAQQNAGFLEQILQATDARFVLVQSPGELDAARALAADTTAALRLAPADSAPGLYVYAVSHGAPAAPAAAPVPPDSARR